MIHANCVSVIHWTVHIIRLVIQPSARVVLYAKQVFFTNFALNYGNVYENIKCIFESTNII